jgi:hypothetical protein
LKPWLVSTRRFHSAGGVRRRCNEMIEARLTASPWQPALLCPGTTISTTAGGDERLQINFLSHPVCFYFDLYLTWFFIYHRSLLLSVFAPSYFLLVFFLFYYLPCRSVLHARRSVQYLFYLCLKGGVWESDVCGFLGALVYLGPVCIVLLLCALYCVICVLTTVHQLYILSCHTFISILPCNDPHLLGLKNAPREYNGVRDSTEMGEFA